MTLQAVEPDRVSYYARKILRKIETNFKIIPINSLRNSQYSLKSPIYITIEYENDNVIASFDDIEAFAYSDNEFEALDMLCEEIVILYQDLVENQENLGPLPRRWLSILQNFIQCN
ncbi:MAG TPA: hypothetical protein VK186_22085 [Candidatus Deferrimicrobium sp.]|nr:hypothetical protein [Candidatus Deferrimicrobium sp.]